jgi:hypothetical protein
MTPEELSLMWSLQSMSDEHLLARDWDVMYSTTVWDPNVGCEWVWRVCASFREMCAAILGDTRNNSCYAFRKVYQLRHHRPCHPGDSCEVGVLYINDNMYQIADHYSEWLVKRMILGDSRGVD